MNDNVVVPVDLAKEIAKFIRNNDNGQLEHWAEQLDPINLSDKIFRIVNYYVQSKNDPKQATVEIIEELFNAINSIRIIEESFVLKKDLLNLLK
jgi:hypothetical protein